MASFPSLTTMVQDMCAVVYHLDFDPAHLTITTAYPSGQSEGTPPLGFEEDRAFVGRLGVKGRRSDDPTCDPLMRAKMLRMMGLTVDGSEDPLCWPPNDEIITFIS